MAPSLSWVCYRGPRVINWGPDEIRGDYMLKILRKLYAPNN